MSHTSELLAAVLRQSWRPSPPALELSEEQFARLVPMLIGAGTGALAWWRIRGTPLGDTPPGAQLHDAFRHTALHNAVLEQRLVETLGTLRAKGFDPILIKGWSVGRLYPDPALHPYGDVDLLIRPQDRAGLAGAIRHAGLSDRIDLEHAWFETRDERDWDDLYTRTRKVPLGEGQVRVLGTEDQLRALCFHALYHGVWRPLWLCDVAAALESRPPDFDWNTCLGPDERIRDWIACAIGLAHQILGASVADTPVAGRAENLPRWLVPAVMKEWQTPTVADHSIAEESVLVGLRHPLRLPSILRQRWWNPIRVTVWANGRFDDRSRVPLQLRNYGWQARTFTSRIVSSRRVQP